MNSLLRRLFAPESPAIALVFLFAFSLLLATANLLWTSRQVNAANARARAQCQFDADLGSAPIPVTPKPSLLGVTIIADARLAWHQAGCGGHLTPPTPGFVKWAQIYGLPRN